MCRLENQHAKSSLHESTFVINVITRHATVQAYKLYINLLPWCSLSFLTFSLWLDGVLSLVMDRETTAQEKCFQILEEVLLSSIVPHSKYVAQLTFCCSSSSNNIYLKTIKITVSPAVVVVYIKYKRKILYNLQFSYGELNVKQLNHPDHLCYHSSSVKCWD